MIVIIGNGVSGITAARYIRKQSDEPITIISEESTYFFSRTALMYVYMGHMKFEHTQPYEPHFWERNNIDLLHTRVVSVDTKQKSLKLENQEEFKYSKLILATGSKPNKFGWKGENAKRVSGLYSKQDLESIEMYSNGLKTAAVVGGGLIGVELAEMFLSRNIHVHFIVRETFFWNSVLPEEDAQFVMNHLSKHHGLTMHYDEELEEILTNSENEAIGIQTKNGDRIDCQFVGLTTGVTPNIDFLKSSNIETNRGILINRKFETSIADVYAIGDCAEFSNPIEGRKSIEQTWYTGKIMGEIVAKNIVGKSETYQPGVWFNSAKFFDLEYQTYGSVSNQLSDEHDEFIYTNTKENILLHFVFEKETKLFIGVNNFGMRLRHQVFNEWLLTNSTIHHVLTNLKSANFDPEFYSKYENDIIDQFNTIFGTSIIAEKAKWWQKLISN